MFLGLVVLFCALSAAALGVSVWIFVQAQSWAESSLALPRSLPGPRGPTGAPGFRGPEGAHGQFLRLDVEHLRWESHTRNAFLEFKSEAQGYFCAHTGCGELVVTGEMQVRNPPSGKVQVLRTLRVWVPHEHAFGRLGELVDDPEHADWDVPFDVQYTGWRSSESVGTFTRDEQEDFRVVCLRPREFLEEHDRYETHDDWTWDRGRGREARDRATHGPRAREPTVLEFRIIVHQGDEQVGLTPFETLLPLHRRHRVQRREVD